MKTKVTETIIKETIYVCEVCGATSVYADQIKACEARHGCTHEPYFILMDNYDCNGYKGLEVRCKKCKILLNDKGWPDIEFDEFEDQGTLRRMYILLRRRQRMEEEKKKSIKNPLHLNYLLKERSK